MSDLNGSKSSAGDPAGESNRLKEMMVASLVKIIGDEQRKSKKNSRLEPESAVLIITDLNAGFPARFKYARLPGKITPEIHGQYLRIAKAEIQRLSALDDCGLNNDLAATIGIAGDKILILVGPEKNIGQAYLIAAAKENNLLKEKKYAMAV